MPESDEAPVQERCDAVISAVRVFTPGRRPGGGRPERERPPKVKRRYGREVLVFDTETRSDPSQNLLVGVWRVYLDRAGEEPGATCVEEGFFYPDDLPRRDPDGFSKLESYVRDSRNLAQTAPAFERRLKLWPLSKWIEERLWRCGWDHRMWSHVVGFNLPFDLGRVCPYWSAARKHYLGGWSLGLIGGFDRRGRWKDRKFGRRLLMRAIDPRRTLFAWGKDTREAKEAAGGRDEPALWRPEAPFVDLHTLVFALTDENHDLERACEAFGDPWKKADVPYGKITKRLLKYAREDVAHTAVLYRNCMAELRVHRGVDLVPYALYSPATVGTQYLRAMGVQPPMKKYDLDERIYGWSMASFFGGRAEARIVRTPVPVTLLDAASMYPSVNALLGTWRLMVAENIRADDVTDRVRELVADPKVVDRCFERSFWSDEIGVTLVELSGASGDILPVRAYWDPSSQDPGIGVNPLRYEGTLWYMLPDVLASVALSERKPDVARAIRLVPVGTQDGLRPVQLRDGPTIDPTDPMSDPFVSMVEERHRVEDEAKASGEQKPSRLGKFLKVTANSTSYGVLARFDRREQERSVRVLGPDDEAAEHKVPAVETPGPFCFPPVAASLTAAARLMLALLEREVHQAGGAYAFCDTDSLAIVSKPSGGRVKCKTARGTTVKALSRREIGVIIERFSDLNPYDPELVPTLWDAKYDSLDTPVTCYAISAKRYALYRGETRIAGILNVTDGRDEAGDEESGEGEMPDWSEHGLGLYLDPLAPEDPARDAKGRRVWMRQAWEWILADDPRASMPEWSTYPALTRFNVSSPKLARWFGQQDDLDNKSGQIRPAAFGLLGHPTPLLAGLSADVYPARAFKREAKKWLDGSWYDRRTRQPIRVMTLDPVTAPEAFAAATQRGEVRVQTLADVLARYRIHPEHKSLGPDGDWTSEQTRGLLLRRPVESAPVLTDLTGKEGNKLLERMTGEVEGPEEYRTDYGSRSDRWSVLAVPMLREMRAALGAVELASRAGVSRRSAERASSEDYVRPHRSTQKRYLDAGKEWCRERLVDVGFEPGPDPWGVLWCERKHLATASLRTCVVCGRPVLHPLAQYCGPSCKKRAYRARSRR